MPLPKISDIVHVSLAARGHQPSYRVHIVDIDENSIQTEVPLEAGGHAVRWPVGTRAHMTFSHQGNLYHFNTTLLEFIPGNVLLYRWERPDESKVSKIQRRAYYRISTLLPADIWMNGRPCAVHVVNLSAGGLAFRLPNRDLQPGDIITGTLNLPEADGQVPVSFTGVVRRTEATPNGWMVGVEFTGLTEADRSRIVRYCWKRQRELRAMDIESQN